MDTNLVELARKWGLRFIGYRKVLSELSSGREPWWVDLTFYRYLLASGCEPIGIAYNKVYMRCGDRLAYFSMHNIYHYYYDEDVKALESEVKKINKLKALTTEELEKLYDWLVEASVYLGEFINFGMYGSEPVYLLTLRDINLPLGSFNFYLGDINLYLAKVNATFIIAGSPYTSVIEIWVDAISPTNKSTSFMYVRYDVEEDGTVNRKEISLTRSANEIKKVKRIREEELLRVLNEKHLVIDGLLREVEEVLLNGIKAITTVFLY